MFNTYIYIIYVLICKSYDKYIYLTHNVHFVGIKEVIDKC
jgi:hypothetical protein